MIPREPFCAWLPTLLLVCLLGALAAAKGEVPASQPANDAALRDYLSANGMLNRGLFELAATEYRKFLSEHGDHEKAPVARYGLAVSLFRLNDYEAAVAELGRLSDGEKFEFAVEASLVLGQCQLFLKRYRPAAEAFERILKRQGDHELADDAAAGLIEAEYLDGKRDEVIAGAKSFASRWPESPLRFRAALFTGLSLMAKQDYAAAGDRFESILEGDSKGPLAEQAAQYLAQCRGQGDFEGARAQFEQGRFEQAQKSFEKVRDQQGELADDAAYWAAKCLLRRGEFADAAQRFQQSAEQFPESALLAEMIYDRAVTLLKAARHDDALAAFEQFRSRFPEHALAAEALYLMAVTHHQERRYPASQSPCREFLKQYPTHDKVASIAFLSAENEFLAGNFEPALEAYRRFLDGYRDDPQAEAARFRSGMACYHLERFDEALPLLRQCAENKASQDIRGPALLALGDILFQRSGWKETEAALADYVSLGDDAPSADDALLKLGLARHRQEKYKEALGSYERLIERFEKSPHRLQAIFERGQALLAMKKPQEAVLAFERVLTEGADSRFVPHALNHLGALALQQKDPSKAAEYYDRLADSHSGDDAGQALLKRGEALMAAREFKKAEESFTRLIEQYPSDASAARARAQRAIALSRQGNRQDALKSIQTIEQTSLAQLDPALRRAVLYEKAWCLRESGESDQAAAAYRLLLDDSDSPAAELSLHATLELAEIESSSRRFDAAAALLRRLLDVLSSETSDTRSELREQATYRLAVCEFELDRPEDAAKRFEEFVEAFPKSRLLASARFFAGEALFKLGRFDRSAAQLTRVTQDFKDDAACGPALLRLGECLASGQKWARSEQAFSAYLDRFSDTEHAFQARFGLGWARENQSRWDEAVSAYQEVTARHQGPTAARAQFQIGECFFAKKQYDEAARELLKVDILYAYPEWSAAALFEAGRCFEKLSKTGEAREQFRAVQDKYPETAWAKKATEQLAAGTDTLPGR